MKQVIPAIPKDELSFNKSSFSSLNLSNALLDNIATLGYESMTPIQAQSLPLMLEHRDVIAQAKTGSGKTAAFGLALLNRLDVEKYAVQALVLCPTRELADQVTQAIRQLARLIHNIKVLNLSGGIPMKPQVESLRHSAHIIVGTPGRVLKHLDKETLSLNSLQTLVLDEADRMLDMGFIDAIDDIISLCPTPRQTLLFSATYPAQIKKLCNQFMNQPERIIVKEPNTEVDIEQLFYEVEREADKLPLLKKMLLHYQPQSAIVFCNTKEQTTSLATKLSAMRFSAIALNGDMDQFDRDVAMIRFRNQSATILVATDVAARGLDIKELPAVINYDLAFDHDVHIHRIGRTGRAGCKGLALSITTPADAEVLCAIEDKLKSKLTWNTTKDLTETHSIKSPEMVTCCLNVGRKEKIRPGDILGALTKDAKIAGDAIGKIDITALYSYVAIHTDEIKQVIDYFKNGKIKGLKVNVRIIV